MDKKQIKSVINQKWPAASVTVYEGVYTWLQHTDTEFRNSQAPCFLMNVKLPTFHVNPMNLKSECDEIGLAELVSTLRNAGLCAEYMAGNALTKSNPDKAHLCLPIAVIDAPREQWPVNKVTALGAWHCE